MERAISETNRRRKTQAIYNEKHGIVPRSIEKSVQEIRFTTAVADARTPAEVPDKPARVAEETTNYNRTDGADLATTIESEMRQAAASLDFEKAARLRDQLFDVKAQLDT